MNGLLYEFAKGVVFSFAFIITIIVFIVGIVKILNGAKEKSYKDLIDAFTSYRDVLIHNNEFDNISEIDIIIEDLKKGVKSKVIQDYDIKSNSSLIIKEVKNGQSIGINITYKIVGRKVIK